MIKNCLIAEDIKSYKIFQMSDVGNDEKWVKELINLVPEFSIVFTGNKLTESLLQNAGYKVKKVNIIEGINGTTIRDKIINNEDWKDLVHSGTLKVIEKVDGVGRIRELG